MVILLVVVVAMLLGQVRLDVAIMINVDSASLKLCVRPQLWGGSVWRMLGKERMGTYQEHCRRRMRSDRRRWLKDQVVSMQRRRVEEFESRRGWVLLLHGAEDPILLRARHLLLRVSMRGIDHLPPHGEEVGV